MSLAPLDLVSADAWHRVTFTTYALSLSFFEAIVLDRLIRGGGRQAVILADVEGVRASLGEQGAQRVGKDYEVEPVAVTSGVFHPKVCVFAGREDCHLLVGSGNLTFGGWGANFETLEHLHPSFAADAFSNAAEFFERLSVTGRVRHGARSHCDATAADLRRAIEGRPLTGNIRFLHNLDWSIAEQVVAAVEELGGATQLIAAAPFWDDGAAIDRLCSALRLDSVLIHAHAHGAVEGRAGANWPAACRSAVQPVRLDVMTEADQPRRLHAKAFEILCRQGRIVVSGSANATGAALEADGNVEACLMRIQRECKVGWSFVPAEVPDPQPALENEDEKDLQKCGVLRAVLDGDSLRGEVLTPAMIGKLNVSYLAGAGEQALGTATLSADRRFEISAPALEDLSFFGGRLVIRALDSRGRVAEGFVSVASFAEMTRRAGIAARRLLALLAGTETPADVAVIMSWFHENPGALSGSAPQGFGGGDHRLAGKQEELVVVASLSDAAVTAAQAGATQHHEAGGRGWSRFMEQILSAFRQKRGAFGAAGGDAVQGLHAVLPQSRTLAELWTQVQSIRTTLRPSR